MWQCYTHNAYLLFLPPHTSHVLQPLDQSIFSPVKLAYRKELHNLSQWNDSTIKGRRNSFIVISGHAQPLLSSLLLPNATTPSTPLNKATQDTQGIQDTQDIKEWASASSAVARSTPKKVKELNSQLDLFSKLDQSIATQRQLFRKVKNASKRSLISWLLPALNTASPSQSQQHYSKEEEGCSNRL
ncbi:transposase [Colletotrichum incanum]|nr:transposase [Colletotrichum incanum]